MHHSVAGLCPTPPLAVCLQAGAISWPPHALPSCMQTGCVVNAESHVRPASRLTPEPSTKGEKLHLCMLSQSMTGQMFAGISTSRGVNPEAFFSAVAASPLLATGKHPCLLGAWVAVLISIFHLCKCCSWPGLGSRWGDRGLTQESLSAYYNILVFIIYYTGKIMPRTCGKFQELRVTV